MYRVDRGKRVLKVDNFQNIQIIKLNINGSVSITIQVKM